MSILIELLEEILRCGWLSPMSIQERIAFVTSVALVSQTWLVALTRITCKYVYIHSTPHHRQSIIGQSPFFHKYLPEVRRRQLCRTITRQIPVPDNITKNGLYKGKYIQNMLSTFHRSAFMPHLRNLTIEYYNLTFGRYSFCASILQLDLEYTFASDCPRWFVDALIASRHSTSKHLPWALPYLEHISTPVNEDPITSINNVLDRSPHLRLADENFAIHVHVFSSSGRVPKNCTIFHDKTPSFDTCVMNYDDFGPKTVRGNAPALVFTKGDNRVSEPSIDLTNMFRDVHVFVHKDG